MVRKNNFLKIIIFFFLISCDDPKITNSKILIGSQVFSKDCVSCHQKGLVLNNGQYELKLSDIVYIVTNGAGNGMPAFENNLSKEEIEVVSYFYKYKKQWFEKNQKKNNIKHYLMLI